MPNFNNTDNLSNTGALGNIGLGIGGYQAAVGIAAEGLGASPAAVSNLGRVNAVTNAAIQAVDVPAANEPDEQAVQATGLLGSVAGGIVGTLPLGQLAHLQARQPEN